jgi:hypothetical protein
MDNGGLARSLDSAAAVAERDADGRRKPHARVSAAVSAVGLLLLAASYTAPGFRAGDVVGANIGAGLVFGLGCLTILTGFGVAVVGAWRKTVRLWALLLLVAIPIAAAWAIVELGWSQFEGG